jgi:hypothetical protein
MTIASGTRLGPYELLAPIGAGKLMAADVRATGSKLETEEPKPLFDLRREALEVSPDGSRFLAFVPVDTEPAPVTVVLNWGLGREK